jgi:flagellar hook-basal body complex protein FliE
MAIPPIPPITSVASAGDAAAVRPAAQDGGGFLDALGEQLGKLSALDAQSAQQAQALATGQAQDLAGVVMAVEKATLAFQLAAQVRNKAVEAYQDLFRMQV